MTGGVGTDCVLTELIPQALVLLCLDPIGLRRASMSLCLLPVLLNVTESRVGHVQVQQCGRLVGVGACPEGRGRSVRRPLCVPPGLSGERLGPAGVIGR